MNKVFMTGNLTRDPELTETPSGVSVCHFAIAVNRPHSDSSGERQTDFFNCTAWRGLAETVGKYCVKGSKVAVVGSVQIRNYEDNKGITRTSVDVIVQDIEFLNQRERQSGNEQREAPAKKPAPKQTSLLEDDDGDIPF